MAENPLLTALPPASDYLTYLTILEYNLTAHQLPILHNILQDTTLTANIGWDLVHLLLPLLPASQQCLLDVARLGNPREVVLKVTEILEALGLETAGKIHGTEGEEGDELGILNETALEEKTSGDQQAVTPPFDFISFSAKPSKKSQFVALLEMLSILHPRIKTKYPSRFLSTSLREILPVYLQLAADTEATEALLNFVKTVSGGKRPKLPPRKSSTAILANEKTQIAPDPEGQEDVSGPEESMLQNRLFQSFLTYVIDDFISSVPSVEEDIPGLAWSCRLQEKLHPDKVIRGRETYLEMFSNDEELHGRDVIAGQIVALSRDLRITPEELLSVITKPEVEHDATAGDLPTSAADVQLSRTGSLPLLCAFTAASSLFDVKTAMPPMNIFPEYAAILESFIGDESMNGIGLERASFADAVIFLGLFILETSSVSPPQDKHSFTSTLQRLSLLSANTPSAPLRYNAHLLTTKILHSHPSGETRLAFIQDTLQHCPYENLKTSAVGWLKDEILLGDEENRKRTGPSTSTSTPFTSPSTLSTLSSTLFLDPRQLPPSSPSNEHSTFLSHHSFYLAVLNFLYLLLTSPSLFLSLDIKSLIQTSELRLRFLDPLKQISDQIQSKANRPDEDEEVSNNDMALLDGMLQMVEKAMDNKGV